MEKIPPLYNEEGQVNDQDIARTMAENEDLYHREDAQRIRDAHSHKSDKEYEQMIGEEVEGTGKVEHALKHLPALIEKMRNALTPEELGMLKTAARNYKTEYESEDPYQVILKKIFEE